MRAPSEKKLLEAFRDLTPKDAKLIRKFAKAADDRDELEELVEKVPATEDYVRQMYRSPYNSQMWRVTVAMHAIDQLVNGYGVEALGKRYEYVNTGDTYNTTLIYDNTQDRLFIGDWGSIVEGGYEPEDNPKSKKAPSGWALVRARGMDDVVLSVHKTEKAAENAMRKKGGTPHSAFTSGMRIVAVGPGTGTEVIEVFGKKTTRASSKSKAQIAKEWAKSRSPAAVRKERERLQRVAPLPEWRTTPKKRGKKAKKAKNPVNVRSLVAKALK